MQPIIKSKYVRSEVVGQLARKPDRKLKLRPMSGIWLVWEKTPMRQKKHVEAYYKQTFLDSDHPGLKSLCAWLQELAPIFCENRRNESRQSNTQCIRYPMSSCLSQNILVKCTKITCRMWIEWHRKLKILIIQYYILPPWQINNNFGCHCTAAVVHKN